MATTIVIDEQMRAAMPKMGVGGGGEGGGGRLVREK
jgi:hypothetical protein